MANPFDQFDELSETSGNVFDQFDKEKPARGVGYGKALKGSFAGLGTTADIALSSLAGGAAGLFGQEEEQARIYKGMEERAKAREEWAGLGGVEPTFGEKLVSTVATLPMQITGAGLSPAETGKRLLDVGETLPTALKGAAVDAAGNIVGMVLPGFKQGRLATRALTGAGAGASQEYATKAAIQVMAETEAGKRAFEPSLEEAAISGIIGGGAAAAAGKRLPKSASDRVNKMKQEAEMSRPMEVEGQAQLEMFPRGEEGLATPYEAGQMGVTEPVSPKLQRRQMELPFGEEVGPLTADIQGQIFRGDVTTPEARLALEGQAKAFRQEIDAGRMPDQLKTGEPLPALQDPAFLDALRREYLEEPEKINNQVFETLEAQRAALKQQQMDEMFAQAQTPEQSIAAAERQRRRDEQEETLTRLEEDLRQAVPGIGAKGRVRKQGGGVLFEFGKKKQTTDATDIERLQKQIDELGRRYVNSEISFEEFSEANHKLIGEKIAAEQLQRKRAEAVGAKEVEDIYPGYREIPVGTKVEAKHGLAYSTPTRGTVVGSRSFRYGEKAYILPVVDFGDGKGRPILPGDISNVFGGPRTVPSPGGKQKGAILFDFGKNKQEETQIENTLLRSEDRSFIPSDPDISKEVEKALSEGKDGKLFTYLQSGATSAAMKSGSAAIQAASRITQNALKRAELAVRTHVFPAEQSLKRLSKQQIVDLHELFKDEMFSGNRMPADVLERNLSVEELKSYVKMRDMFDDALASQNTERGSKGLKPISAKEAYVSSRWSGDFRRPVRDKDGNLVWYLASNSKIGLDMQSKALLKKFPDLVIDPKQDHSVKASRYSTDLQAAYSKILDVLGRDDPAVEKIRQAVEEQITIEGELTRGQEKHFKRKAGIRGFVGDRPGLGVEVGGKIFSIDPNPIKEALAFFEQQIQYAKNAYTWSEMQKAADGVKQIVGNEDLQTQQPNNVKYIREYFKNAIGLGESKVMRAVEDSLRDGFGVSPKILDDAVGGMKGFFILQHLAASAGYTISSMIQASNVMPYLVDLRAQGHKGNPGTALAVGVPAGMAMAVAHYLKSIGGEYVSRLPSQFMRDAFQYAEDNGVTSRSIYDEAPLGAAFSPIAQAGRIAGKTITIPETFVRGVAFMSYAQMLKDGGQFKDMSKLFQKAEELVNASMVDYRSSERPLLFSKGGIAGNFLNTLQTFPMSFYNQWIYFANQASKGNVLPFVTAGALQYAISGVQGVPYFDDITKLWALIRDNVLPTGMWANIRKNKFLSDPKLWILENLGQGALYGALSDKSGVGLTSRVSAPGVGAMLQSPVGPVTDIASQVGSLAQAAMSPTDPGKWAQVAMKSTPTGLQGLVETLAPMEDFTYVTRPDGTKVFMKSKDLEERKGGYARTPEEIAMRKWGLRSQKEVVSREVTYSTQQANKLLEEKSGELVGKFYDAVRKGNVKKARELNQLYLDLTGKAISKPQIEAQQKQEMMTDIERSKLGANTPQKMANVARMNKILKEISVENE